jgi:hypothetical protein
VLVQLMERTMPPIKTIRSTVDKSQTRSKVNQNFGRAHDRAAERVFLTASDPGLQVQASSNIINRSYHTVQRQAAASHVGRVHGNRALKRDISFSVREVQSDEIRVDATQSKARFDAIRTKIDSYSTDCVHYFGLQVQDAFTSFKGWYARQGTEDPSFLTFLANVMKNSIWAWGIGTIEKGLSPVASILFLAAKEAGGELKRLAEEAAKLERDRAADALIQAANNHKSIIEQKLSGQVVNILEQNAPNLWEEIQRRAYLNESWQPLLHEQAGLPKQGVPYHQIVLANLIFQYRQWELSQHSRSYQGIDSIGDPYKHHMRARAEVEAYVQTGRPIPRRLASYARPNEVIDSQ